MENPKEIIDALRQGDETLGDVQNRIAAELGVNLVRVQRAAREAKLPALWFDTLERMAGRNLPRDAFNWKRAK